MSRKLGSFISAEAESKKETLALMADTTTGYNHDRHRVLKELGLTNTDNIAVEAAKEIAIKGIGVIKEEENYISDTKRDFIKKEGFDAELIELSKLIEYCKVNSIVFGKASLFTSKLPEEIVEALIPINYNRFNSYKQIITKDTIVNNEIHHNNPQIFIASAPKNFTNKGVVISNCELVESPFHKNIILSNTKCEENLLMTPLKFKDKIFFLIIKIW